MLKYRKQNVNLKNKVTTDCVVRAICFATQRSYKEIATELFENYLKTGYAMNDKKNYEKWLEQNGWEKMRQPRKSDNTKYLVGEIDEVTTHSSVIISCAHHLTCRINDEIVDIWDCRGKTIGNYWVYRK